MRPLKRLPFLFRDHRDQLRQRWLEALEAARAGEDYRELMASPVGDRFLRKLVEDLIAVSEAEAYELPAVHRRLHEEAGREAGYRLSLGFARLDLVKGWQAILAAAIDLLQDAVAVGEAPPVGEALLELKELAAFVDHMVRVTVGAPEAERAGG